MVVGVLGGIGSGKSTVTGMFVELGAKALSADQVAHEALQEPEVRQALVAFLGRAVLEEDGSVDRARVARRVFDDPEALKSLEALVHPRVRERMEREIRAHVARPGHGMLILDVPLLLESPLRRHCDAIVFVDAPLEVRRSRTRERGWEPGEVDRRERHQASLEKKREAAEFIIDNGGSLDATRAQVKACFQTLSARATKGGSAAS
jgi:dephospho-CoA kinase